MSCNKLREAGMRWLALAAILLLVGAGCSADGDAAAGPQGDARPSVVATVAPLTDLVRQVLGDRGQLRALVPDGVDSHTYEPTPGDARALGEADLFIANGLALEQPALRLAEANLPEGAPIVTLAERAISRDEWVFDFSYPEQDGLPNPHLWLDVVHAMSYVADIRDALVEVDPAGEPIYRTNADRYLEELRALHEAIATAVATIPEPNRKLVTYHDSWPYFGQRYGLEVVSAVQPSDFSEPSAAEVRQIIDQVRDEDVPAVFGSEVFPSAVVRVIADEAGAVYVEELSDDELPGAPGDPDHSYVGMMARNVRTMVANLGGDPSALDAVDPAR